MDTSKFKIDFLESYDEASILEELKRIANFTGKGTVSKNDLKKYGKVSYSLVNRKFGSLRQALQKADLTPTRFMKATDGELINMLLELWEQVLEKEGRTPQQKDLKNYGYSISLDTIKRRSGTWRKALMKAYESIESDKIEEELYEAPNQNHVKRGNLSLRKRFFVFKRDGFTCVRCGANGPGVRIEVDHKVPISRGGSDALDNLQTLCFKCNRGKRNDLESV